MPCQICCQNDRAPYKCPKCRIKYCSVSCYQKHKSSEACQEQTTGTTVTEVCQATATTTPRSIELGDDDEADYLSPDVLERIGHSVEVRELLKNRHLRAMIKMLDRSINPADDMQKAMIEPIFVQFVDQLLMVVERKKQ